jgi:hypothetical protein
MTTLIIMTGSSTEATTPLVGGRFAAERQDAIKEVQE